MLLRGLYKLIVRASGIALIAIVLSALVVTQNARRIADGSPYCIQVAGGENKYKPARTWLDLSLLSLWGTQSNGYYIAHHAILVVDRDRDRQQRYHWSYWQQRFVPGLRNEDADGFGSAIACEPAPGFAGSLRWIVPATADSDYVRFSAHEAYRIPRSYHANWHGGAAGYWLQLGAPAPDFPPLNKSQEDSTPKERINDWIIINSHPALSAKMVESINSDLHVMERSVEFGLQKQKILTEGNYLNVRSMYRYSIPVDERADGPDPTLISCQTPSAYDPKSCGHSFINKGRNIFFRHRAEDLANWRDMQKRVLELLASFETKGAARPQ